MAGRRHATEASLGYARARTVFRPGDGFRLDASYCRCHLPLVAPAHPDVIGRDDEHGYVMGVHREVMSLVAPLDMAAIESSPGWRTLDQALRGGPLAGKIAWEIAERRRDKVHATLCGDLDLAALPPGWRDALSRLGPISVKVGGVFSGNINLGRLYLALYPELRGRQNLFQTAQGALGRKAGDMYLAGVHNLTDHLDAAETAWLADFLRRWSGAEIATVTLSELWVLGSRDDLVLDSRIVERIALA